MTGALVLDQLSTLSDAIRVRMLAVLEGRELTVSELCDVLQLPQSTVSRHLKILSDGGWVTSRRDGTSRLYSLPGEELASPALALWNVVREQIAVTMAAKDDARRLARVLGARRAKSEAFFSTAAAEWDRLRDELFGSSAHLRALLGLLDPSWTVGDLGCGTGVVSEWLAPFVARVVAVDSSREMLEAARARFAETATVDVRHGSLEALPVADGELNAALLLLVLHHLPEPGRVVAEAARALAPGGRLLILDMVPHDREDYRHTMGHVWLGFPPKQLTRWLEAAGLGAVRITPLMPDRGTRGPSLFVATAVRGSPSPPRTRDRQRGLRGRRKSRPERDGGASEDQCGDLADAIPD